MITLYELYCQGYTFLYEIGLGVSLELYIVAPMRYYDVDTYHELTPKQQQELLDEAYPIAKKLAIEVKEWLSSEAIILTGERYGARNWEYIDHRIGKNSIYSTFFGHPLNLTDNSVIIDITPIKYLKDALIKHWKHFYQQHK